MEYGSYCHGSSSTKWLHTMPPTTLTYLEMTTTAPQNIFPMACPTHLTLEPGSSAVQNAFEASRVFAFVGLKQIIAQLCDAVLAYLLRQWTVQFSINNLFCSGNQSPFRPHCTAAGLPHYAAQVAEFGLAVASKHCVSLAAGWKS